MKCKLLFDLLAMVAFACVIIVIAGQDSTAQVISGVVRDSNGAPVPAARILVENDAKSDLAETTTGTDGKFSLRFRREGRANLRVQKAGFDDAVQSLPEAKATNIEFVLSPLNASAPTHVAPSSPNSMELEDKPHFTVAGITDWTAAGGHGSDANLRASESLARETRALDSKPTGHALISVDSEIPLRAAVMGQPDSFQPNHALGNFYLQNHRFVDAVPLLGKAFALDPSHYENSYELAEAYEGASAHEKARDMVRLLLSRYDRAELHRLLGDIDEESSQPLAAEREYEKAVRQDPSEENYFDWAGELLVHRAVEPAIEVFTKGAGAYPRSERMLAGLGAALFANGQYAAAAQRVCDASDLNQADPNPYLFLGKMEQVSTEPLPCVEEQLARFARDHPENPWATFYYALALTRTKVSSAKEADTVKVEALLNNIIRVDPRFAQAYLQLGILFSERGDPARAIESYQEAIAADSNLAEAHFRLAQSYRHVGENAKATHELQIFERIQRSESAQVEEHRREIRQFVVVMRNSPESNTK